MPGAPQPVLLYDGECGLCNFCVRRLLKWDKAGRLRFAALQSGSAQAYLRARGLPTRDFDSLVFVPDWAGPHGAAPLLRTDGALAACALAGGPGRVLAGLRVLPRGARDWIYRLVARSRYALFGEYRPTSLPKPEWRSRFL
jgi:predicted DCC family thiol-disulfide oxidoreductase YuxK